ncbi:L-fucose/L-arabinose isomerase family protein [Candidatus Bathyarchaeota archaeon]|nr:L-fucose/L-arabinose isomerase family protein [Candidatus Bathyarchaeota archaeon]
MSQKGGFKVKIGFVPSHRSIFDENWAINMRKRCLEVFSSIEGLEIIVPDEKVTRNGLVSSEEDADKTICLFREKEIDGVIIGTMTFGEEVPALKIASAFADKPILLFGTKEPPFTPEGKRLSDSFCGTLSISSGLHRRKIPFLFAGIIFPEEDEFKRAVENFVRTCAIVKEFIGARIGQIGPRPRPFETCVFNEAALIERFDQTIIPASLSEIFNMANSLSDDDPRVKEVIKEIEMQADTSLIKPEALLKLAKLEVALSRFAEENNLSAMAVQCWDAMQDVYGTASCLPMARLTDRGIMTACEVDVYGALTMLIQYLASLKKTPPHFIDWTIQHQEKENVFLAWHCGNAPPSLACEGCKRFVREHFIMENTKPGKACGTIEFQLKPGVVTICRLIEYDGEFKMLVTKGEIKQSADNIRGAWSWIEVPNLKFLYRVLVEEGFIHHASIIHGDYTEAIIDACRLLGIETIVV